MSAYIVSRHHVIYLVKSAINRPISDNREFRYYHKGEWRTISDGETQTRIANVLWRENVKSVLGRYPGDTEQTAPGPIGETYWIQRSDLSMLWGAFDPVQIIKSARCYEYQSCEHEGWEQSEAKAFIGALIPAAIRELPGMEQALWDAPQPMGAKMARVA